MIWPCSKIWGSVSGRDGMVRARCPRSSVEAGKKCIKLQRSKKEQHSSQLRKLGACLRGTRICFRLRRVDAYDQQKGLDFCWNGYIDEVVQSYDSHNRQWRCADAWRGKSVCQRIGYILDFESPREHASSLIAWKALRLKRKFLWMDQRSKKHISKKIWYSDTMQHRELRS